jgi:hypothetical protein
MKKLIISIILVLLTNAGLLSQQYNCNCIDDIGITENFQGKLSGRYYVNRMMNYGSQFFYKWANGDVIMNDGQIIRNKLIRYNRYYDELIWLRKPDYKTAIIGKETVDEFIIYSEDNTPYAHFRKTKIKNWYQSDSIDVFLQVLTEGNISLYVFRTVTVIRNKIEIYDKDIYYLMIDNTYYRIDPSRRGLMRAIPQKKAELKQIIRKNRLKLKSEPHLIKAIELLNKEYYLTLL